MNFDNYIPKDTELITKNNVFGIKTLYIKDETKNITHTFKDRLAYEMLRPIIEKINKGEKITKTTFCSISYGNTAYSMGYYCNLLNKMYGDEIVNAVAIVPPNLSSKIYGPDTEGRKEKASNIFKRIKKYCSIIELDLEKQYYSSSDLEKVVREHNLCYDDFINVTEGLDRPAYVNIISETIEKQLDEEPDYIIVPFGAGILCNEIMDYVNDNKLKSKVIPVSSGNPNTIAIMLYGPIWVNVKELEEKGKALSYHKGYDLKGRKREPYMVYNIKDDEILKILDTLSEIGVSSEPSAAAGFAFINKLKEIDNKFNPEKHSVLVINTGNSFLNKQNKNEKKL